MTNITKLCFSATSCRLFLMSVILSGNTEPVNSESLIKLANTINQVMSRTRSIKKIGVYILNKFVTTFFATTAAAVGLFFAGSVNADASTTYTVKSGDSVWAISQKYNTTINAIETANHIQNHLILPGQHLTITDGTSTTKTQTTYTTPAKSTQSSTYSNQASSNNSSQANTSSNYSSNNNYSNQANTTSTQSTSNASSSNSSNSSSSNSSSSNSSYTGSNLKSYVLSQMSSRTGVSASTWNTIIQRESNWQPSVRNSSSGAYGLFQNMHISSGSVSEQVDAAVSLYNAQGMSAWAL